MTARQVADIDNRLSRVEAIQERIEDSTKTIEKRIIALEREVARMAGRTGLIWGLTGSLVGTLVGGFILLVVTRLTG